SFGDAVPAEGIHRIRVRGNADGVGFVVGAGVERSGGAAVFVVAQSPERKYGGERDGRGDAPGRTFLARADFLIDKGKQRGHGESENEDDEKDRLDDVNDVPGDPAFGERPEGTNSVAGRVVEQNVAEPGEAGIPEKQPPARGKIGVARLAAAQAPDSIHKSNDNGGDKRHAKK